MRRIVAGVFQSLDGVVQGPGGPGEDESGGFPFGGWVVPHFDAEAGGFVGELFGGPYDLLLGRRTYDIFAAHWPHSTEQPIADQFNACTKYVVTSSREPLEWRNSRALAGIDAVAALRDVDGSDLIVQGSHTLHGPLLARGLIDRLVLMTFPVVLGRGKRLFDVGDGSGQMRLVDQRASPSGVIRAVYEPAGPVATGSFALEDQPA